ncbi:MAG: (4Fe-4S)-binding protein [Chitinophagales bacterium]
MGQKTFKYSNGEITIVWQPEICKHSGNCVRGLPKVFDWKRRPWIDPMAADSQTMMEQVKKCPSGALSFLMNREDQPNNQ